MGGTRAQAVITCLDRCELTSSPPVVLERDQSLVEQYVDMRRGQQAVGAVQLLSIVAPRPRLYVTHSQQPPIRHAGAPARWFEQFNTRPKETLSDASFDQLDALGLLDGCVVSNAALFSVRDRIRIHQGICLDSFDLAREEALEDGGSGAVFRWELIDGGRMTEVEVGGVVTVNDTASMLSCATAGLDRALRCGGPLHAEGKRP